MTEDLVLWPYLVDAVLMIVHETVLALMLAVSVALLVVSIVRMGS